jgi:hypothetical protein
MSARCPFGPQSLKYRCIALNVAKGTSRHCVCDERQAVYFNAVEIVEKVVLRWVPIPVMTGIMASAIPAAMRPYSMAVAADSSLKKAMSFRRIANL